MERASANKVLIIEDECDVVDLLALNLRKAGFSASSAADGTAGLEKARDERR
jgi:DNA-binding response OmpR family regulator